MRKFSKINRVTTLICLCVLFSGCNAIVIKSNEIKSGEVVMLENLKAIDTYSFYEKDNDLFFKINLKNNTNESLEVDATIRPFGVYYNKEMLKSNMIIPSLALGTPPAIMTVKPNESRDFTYKISKDYHYKNGEHDYDLIYLYHFYDVDTNYKFDNYLKTIKFRWYAEEGIDKGTLVSTNFNSK